MKCSYNLIFAHHFFGHLKVNAQKEDPQKLKFLDFKDFNQKKKKNCLKIKY